MLKKLQKFPQHSAFYHSAGFSFNNHYSTPSIGGNTTLTHTPVVSKCILIAADQNSTVLLAKRTHRPEVKTTAFCVVARSETLPRRTEGRAKRLHESQNPEKLHEG